MALYRGSKLATEKVPQEAFSLKRHKRHLTVVHWNTKAKEKASSPRDVFAWDKRHKSHQRHLWVVHWNTKAGWKHASTRDSKVQTMKKRGFNCLENSRLIYTFTVRWHCKKHLFLISDMWSPNIWIGSWSLHHSKKLCPHFATIIMLLYISDIT